MPDQAPAAFISYCRDDSDFALRLAQDLKAAGAAVWIDQLDIVPGDLWDNAVEDALIASSRMLLILSPESSRSKNVRNEISFALEQGKTVIPVLYRDCTVPLQLQRNNRIDFRADYARGLASVLASLHVTDPNPVILHDAAEAEAKRKAAWQAREAEAQRLQQLEDQKHREEADRLTREADDRQRGQTLRSQQEETARLARETVAAPQAHTATAAHETQTPNGPPTPAKPWLQRTGSRVALAAAFVVALLVVLVVTLSRKPSPEPKPTPSAPKLAATQPPPPLPPSPSAEATKHPTAKLAPDPPRVIYPPAPPAKPQQTTPKHSATAPTPAVPTPAPPPPNSPAILEKKGMDFFSRKQYDDAVPLFLLACNGGDAVGCDYLGFMYSHGEGVAIDPGAAEAYYQKSCASKDANGCNDLGRFYLYDGRIGDASKAVAPFQTACDNGSGPSCSELGTMYFDSPGIVDKARARDFYQKGCELGFTPACEYLKKLQ